MRLAGHLRAWRQAAPPRGEARSPPKESYSLLVVGKRSIARTLDLRGYSVAYESSADVTLQRVDREQPDAVILDMRMSEVDGLEVSRRLRRRGGRFPVLLLLPRSASPSAVDGFDAGADACVVGPFSFEELVARLRALLRWTSQVDSRDSWFGRLRPQGPLDDHGRHRTLVNDGRRLRP
jgi:DNA-binding response OmpR family regulator